MIFKNGAAGIVLSHKIFAQKNLSREMEKIHWLIHEKETVQ
jgi:DhnA family fructose-bisphosphate aldolase class Ia